METIYYALIGVFGFLVFLYANLDVHYFLRMLLVLICSKFKKRIFILDEGVMRAICLTTDVDLLLFHMNNGRYVRELDFARFDFFRRSGLLAKIKEKKAGVVQGANSIRYRKYIRPFSLYEIRSKILYWDDQNIYMEHRFVTPGDNFVRAIAMGCHRIINCNASDIMTELITVNEKLSEEWHLKPKPPLELAKWIESNEISSSNLRSHL